MATPTPAHTTRAALAPSEAGARAEQLPHPPAGRGADIDAVPTRAVSIAELQARNFQDHGAIQWMAPVKRAIGTPALGPLPGAQQISDDWDSAAQRFVKAVVYNAYLEHNECFGPEWTTRHKDLAQIQASGVTALGVSFFAANNADELASFCAAVPQTEHPSFAAALRDGMDAGQEVICATWWPGYTLRHGAGELEQCEHWISLTHPGYDHFASVWACWPPRTIGGATADLPSVCIPVGRSAPWALLLPRKRP